MSDVAPRKWASVLIWKGYLGPIGLCAQWYLLKVSKLHWFTSCVCLQIHDTPSLKPSLHSFLSAGNVAVFLASSLPDHSLGRKVKSFGAIYHSCLWLTWHVHPNAILSAWSGRILQNLTISISPSCPYQLCCFFFLFGSHSNILLLCFPLHVALVCSLHEHAKSYYSFLICQSDYKTNSHHCL